MTVIQATLRSAQGTGASRRLRNENKVPAVVYGLGESKAISNISSGSKVPSMCR